MQPTDDAALLRRYVENQSDEAFAALVARHINLVYSVALRQTGHPQNAEEITQAVFLILAKKAAQLRHDKALSSWLFQTTRWTATNFIRSELRRQRREQEAHMRSVIDESGNDIWPQIAPLLDAAVAGLGEKERRAVVLRYYEGKNLPEVSAALDASEAAVAKRLVRALEKLRKFFTKRGVSLSATAIAGAVAANSVQAAPLGLALSVTAATAKGAVVGSSTLTLIKGALKVMAWTKAKTVIVTGVVVLLAAGTATVTVKEIAAHKAADSAEDSWRVKYFDSRLMDTAKPQLKILPTKFPGFGGWGTSNGKAMGICATSTNLVQAAYDFFQRSRLVVLDELPPDRFDFIASLPKGSQAALQQEVKQRFGVTAKLEKRETDVYRLVVKTRNAPRLKPHADPHTPATINNTGEHFSGVNVSTSFLAEFLEDTLQVPVIDETHLAGNFDIDVKWHPNDPQYESLKQNLIDQLGLELVPDRKSLEMLVVKKAD